MRTNTSCKGDISATSFYFLVCNCSYVTLDNNQLDALFLNVFISSFQETGFLLTGLLDTHPPECFIPDDV